jgi:hypothetical protein
MFRCASGQVVWRFVPLWIHSAGQTGVRCSDVLRSLSTRRKPKPTGGASPSSAAFDVGIGKRLPYFSASATCSTFYTRPHTTRTSRNPVRSSNTSGLTFIPDTREDLPNDGTLLRRLQSGGPSRCAGDRVESWWRDEGVPQDRTTPVCNTFSADVPLRERAAGLSVSRQRVLRERVL